MRRKPYIGMRALLAGAAMTAVAAVAACDGDNLFTIPGDGGPAGADTRPPTVDITVPRGDSLSGTALGDSVFVSVRVTDRVGVAKVRMFGFSVRGNAALGTQEAIGRFAEKTVELRAGVKDTTLTRYLLAAGDSVRERAFVVVEATDSAGHLAADTASLSVGGPAILLSGLPATGVLSSGASLTARLRAEDPKGVNLLRLTVTGSLERVVEKALPAPPASIQLDTFLAIPDTAAGPISVRAFARNALGVIERTAAVDLVIADRMPPTAKILLPRGDSLSARPLGDSVLVTARLTDNFGVRSVVMTGVAHRGSRDLGTDVVVPRFVERAITFPAGVRDTTVSRFLRAIPSEVKEMAWIQVIAADAAGNQLKDSVALVLGGPDVELLDIVPGQTIQAGLELTLRVRAKDPHGINRIRITVGGAFQAVVLRAVTPPADSLVMDTVVVVPANVTGPIQITAIAWNGLDVAGQYGPVEMRVVPAGAGDTIPPILKHTGAAPDRMEVQDSVRIEVSGSDVGGGLARVGYTVLAISPTRGDTLVRTDSLTFAPPRTGTVTRTFSVPSFNVDLQNLPDELVFEVHSWMRDAQGNCSASVGAVAPVSHRCGTLNGGATVALGRAGQRLPRTVVSGKTVLLPRGGRIMDAAVDTVRRRMFLSNIRTNRLDVFDMDADRFLASIGVGSEPWGLAINRAGDSLWVANSGGTNFSVVSLDSLKEYDPARLLTPDVLVGEARIVEGDAGIQWRVQYVCPEIGGVCSFSDRPQFVVVDSWRNLIFSTKTTRLGTDGPFAGERGTVRKAYFTDGMERPEVKLFAEHARRLEAEDVWTVLHADDFGKRVSGNLFIADHRSGFPLNRFTVEVPADDVSRLESAQDEIRSRGGDALIEAGRLNWEDVMYRDTTYVAASGDGNWVVVGEGVAAPFGRVLTYQAAQGDTIPVTRMVETIDLITNAAEQVRGVGVNHDGSMAVIRGRFAAYFFSPEDLRLQGVVGIPQAEQGAGAVLHPLHSNARSLTNLRGSYFPDTHLAFVASGERTIDILDTWRFTRIGRVHLRDIVTGPLRAVLPFPEDNAGLTCATVRVTNRENAHIGDAIQIYEGGNFNRPLLGSDGPTDDRCVVMKLFGATTAGGVVVVDVRKGDIFREHPVRQP